ncbi:putative Ig domain-containing protein [Vitiosangium sp. GDMCC 1.1324]|uniref:putative Ig domain-containing protein n=1 Tax=Vitiosangium sp. (strain GDMCC 1.1324) TaxID=2138576 RepID=UPI000D35253C|nr:putative Ig domain-containing protein [Vitiosangium sp. GDMCC 1.1324]PTL82911.1 hemagglutinin [Vitiosangium sp. GDMCC 1.1324]
MPFARLLGTLAVLTALGACTGSPSTNEALQLPDLEQLETTESAPYEVSLGATGGTPPLRHSLEKLPPGFIFHMNEGLLMGPATVPGQYTFTVQVKDAEGATDTRTYQLYVYSALTVSTLALPTASVGQTYGFQLEAGGGKGPMRWTLAGGTLPTGLALGEDGQLTGVPQEPGAYSATVRVQDVHGAQAEKLLDLDVLEGDGGTDTFAFKVANWNLEWFGDPSNGPTNDALQLDNVKRVITTTGADFWGLQELVDATEFEALKQQTGYDGFMANDPGITSGSYYYSADEQKVGVLFNPAVVSVVEKKLILTSNDYDFAGRPPLQVKLRITRNGASQDVVAIILHMKAQTDSSVTSYNRRQSAGVALKSYLDTQLASTPFIVLGDWNDDVDESILRNTTSGAYLPTPYQNFLDDAANYTFVTRPLSLSGQRSTVGNTQFIDHELVSNELLTSYVPKSAQVLNPDTYISQYKATTTDHYPVTSRFVFSAGAPATAP